MPWKAVRRATILEMFMSVRRYIAHSLVTPGEVQCLTSEVQCLTRVPLVLTSGLGLVVFLVILTGCPNQTRSVKDVVFISPLSASGHFAPRSERTSWKLDDVQNAVLQRLLRNCSVSSALSLPVTRCGNQNTLCIAVFILVSSIHCCSHWIIACVCYESFFRQGAFQSSKQTITSRDFLEHEKLVGSLDLVRF